MKKFLFLTVTFMIVLGFAAFAFATGPPAVLVVDQPTRTILAQGTSDIGPALAIMATSARVTDMAPAEVADGATKTLYYDNVNENPATTTRAGPYAAIPERQIPNIVDYKKIAIGGAGGKDVIQDLGG